MKMSEKRIFVRRLWMSLAGVILTALAVAMFKTAALGVDPFQSFVSGMDAVLPLSYGTVYSVICVVLLCFGLICDRHIWVWRRLSTCFCSAIWSNFSKDCALAA